VAGFDVDVARRVGDRTIAARFAGDGLTVLFGRSGAGKTSVLDMIAGLRRPDAGHVRFAGETLFDAATRTDLPPARRRLGYVFQDARLFPHRRVRANLLYGHRLAPAADRWLAPDEAIAFLGLGDLLDRWPRTLSGGEARRVAIGRALLSGARALLMDEPLSFLDGGRRDEILRVVERIRDDLRLPILYVTHDRAEAERLATRIVAIG
jgi:molybdate transport system ATP-binding protein